MNNPTPVKGALAKVAGKMMYYVGRTLYYSKAMLIQQEMKEKGIDTAVKPSKSGGYFIYASERVHLDLSEPLWNPRPGKEPWEVKYYDEIPIADKEALASRADKVTAEQIKKLPEYKKLALESKEWYKTHPGLSASPQYKEQVKLYMDRYAGNLKAEVLKDYPDLVKKPVTPTREMPPASSQSVPKVSKLKKDNRIASEPVVGRYKLEALNEQDIKDLELAVGKDNVERIRDRANQIISEGDVATKSEAICAAIKEPNPVQPTNIAPKSKSSGIDTQVSGMGGKPPKQPPKIATGGRIEPPKGKKPATGGGEQPQPPKRDRILKMAFESGMKYNPVTRKTDRSSTELLETRDDYSVYEEYKRTRRFTPYRSSDGAIVKTIKELLNRNSGANPVGQKATLKCLFCGKVFKKSIGPKTVEIKCPKCGEYDVDVIGNPNKIWHRSRLNELEFTQRNFKGKTSDRASGYLQGKIDEEIIALGNSTNPATSDKQRRLFAIALGIKRGQIPKSYSPEAAQMAKRMSERKLKEFAESNPDIHKLRYFLLNRKTGKVALLVYSKGGMWLAARPSAHAVQKTMLGRESQDLLNLLRNYFGIDNKYRLIDARSKVNVNPGIAEYTGPGSEQVPYWSGAGAKYA